MFDDLPPDVRAAFGVSSGPARRLPGGGGTSWQAGGLVLKPARHPGVASWLAEVFADLRGPGFRVPRPVRAADGSWVAGGWAAWTAVEGAPEPVARWPELVAASRAFHAALADVPAPHWLGRGRSRWEVAERVAWDQAEVELAPELSDLVDELRAATRPVRSPDQLVHGDIAGNVLFAPGQPPAVIDFSPSRRPAGYALAVAAVDLLAWSGASPGILDELAGEDDIDQLLLRALIWRLVTESLGRPDPDSRRAVRQANEWVAELLLSRVSGRPAATGPSTDAEIAEMAGRALGCGIAALRPVAGGHSRSQARIADRAGGGSVFVKVGGIAAELGTELAVYEALGDRPFLPRLLASTREPLPMLVLETLDPEHWLREWTPGLVAATRELLHEVHALPAPPGVPVLRAGPNPWEAVAADPARLLRTHVCSQRWLDDHLDTLHAAAAEVPVHGDCLIHRDVRAANLWCHGGRLVLADWASAAIGDPWLEHHLWLVALHAEGGPAPDAGQGPHAAGHAALIAGQQPLLTPARDADPVLFEQRRRRLTAALSWAARLLDIPPPQPAR
ncbi:TIGR02569 family protein [Microbispora sp. ATCC PTA-5024]|uniref:TIGR02569 family protein n=1 Tax=Microbispora sp. ATCC PTA-5024 TaxID=316330 RepID=UPI0003DD8711|nr:TIGR02569 family protein [Microbispora sp. ATCC PTA-5024]ETK35987.1 aminoglycoside phosphotransferase [Microbispora sp. ATCC PTA-5024]